MSQDAGGNEDLGGVDTKTFAPGEVIFREGQPAQDEAYLVHRGRVEVHRLIDGTQTLLNTLSKGEVALFREGPHSVTATALEDVTLLVIRASRLEAMVQTNPRLPLELIRQLAAMASGAPRTGR